jgi:hypothetical protein
MATESITIRFNYIDTGIGTNTGRHPDSADTDGNIDTCGARAVTAATTFDPTAAVRRVGKGKGTSHRVITSTTHKPPPSFEHTC